MKILQQLPKILFSLTLLLLVQIGFANTNGTEGKKAEEKVKQEQQTGQQKNNQKLDAEPGPTKEGTQGEKEVPQDSVEDDSVSKYNFIFHFLYKFKYDQEEEL